MTSRNVHLKPISFRLTEGPWLGNLRPYEYQRTVQELVEQALDSRKTLCLLLTTPTGSGKTLAAYATSILRGIPALGVYPTNELIKDQERALQPWLDPHSELRLLRIDSRELDRWTVALASRRHAPTLETLLHWHPTVLTNPDILFYVFFGLYGGWEEELEAIRQRLFALIGQYQVFIFDEFHLYNIKQMADTAFLIGTLHAIQPNHGRVFLFASATPHSPLQVLLERMGLPVKTETVEPVPEGPGTRRVAQPLRLTLVPANLASWEGPKVFKEFLPEVRGFLEQYPGASLVIILDSVAGAMSLARDLRKEFGDQEVGEVHGFSSPQERDEALRRRITVGTSTIEVGVDFVGEQAKDVLVFEARTADQFIQRLGRIARHEKSSNVPYWAVALVPEYVYNFLAKELQEGQEYERKDLYQWVEKAYKAPENFRHYLHRHAPVEFHAARKRVLDGLWIHEGGDTQRTEERLRQLGKTLTGVSEEKGWALYAEYEKEGILYPLLTFRGSGLEVAIVDDRGTDSGFPLKRYDLMFLLRRGSFSEIPREEYEEKLNELERDWPVEVALERRYARLIGNETKDLLGVYGYFRLTGLLDQARRVWLEIGEEAVSGRKGQVVVLQGLEVYTDPAVNLLRLNRHLKKKKVVAWVTDKKPEAIRLSRSLPPLFEVYELKVRRSGGRDITWSIAFNQNAFFLDSLDEKHLNLR
ncbi:MAG: type I-D CRISPR-associated helicase Cas3' [Thermus sp.]|uniref:type I-D CRISPR-associated helicase Cas3' n=1 Tax=Thermus sp. TaxID=275 RepID=UPI0039188299